MRQKKVFQSLRKEIFFSIFCGMFSVLIVFIWIFLESRTIRVQAPFEDAAMLFKYAVRFAEGNGIIWNLNELPSQSDGATDLGFVLTLGPLIYLGISPEISAQILNFICVFILGTFLYFLNQKLWKITSFKFFIFLILIFSPPVNRFISSGFSPVIFSTILVGHTGTLTFAYLNKFKNNSTGIKMIFLAGFFAGLAGWWRPEGFAIAPILFFAYILYNAIHFKYSLEVFEKEMISYFTPYLSLLFFWVTFRLTYFDQLLPTSAVLKSGSELKFENFLYSGVIYLGYLVPIFILIFNSNKAVLKQVIPIALFAVTTLALIWVPITMSMNWWHRMQWPLVFQILILMLSVISFSNISIPQIVKKKTSGIFSILIAIFLFSIQLNVIYNYNSPPGYFESKFHIKVASALAAIDSSSLRVATTEAGLIPLAIEKGLVLDTYGHNNRSIAESSGNSLLKELEELNPYIIVVHGIEPTSFANSICVSNSFSDDWNSMVIIIYNYIYSMDFTKIYSEGVNSCDSWNVFVSNKFPNDEYKRLTDSLRAPTY